MYMFCHEVELLPKVKALPLNYMHIAALNPLHIIHGGSRHQELLSFALVNSTFNKSCLTNYI